MPNRRINNPTNVGLSYEPQRIRTLEGQTLNRIVAVLCQKLKKNQVIVEVQRSRNHLKIGSRTLIRTWQAFELYSNQDVNVSENAVGENVWEWEGRYAAIDGRREPGAF